MFLSKTMYPFQMTSCVSMSHLVMTQWLYVVYHIDRERPYESELSNGIIDSIDVMERTFRVLDQECMKYALFTWKLGITTFCMFDKFDAIFHMNEVNPSSASNSEITTSHFCLDVIIIPFLCTFWKKPIRFIHNDHDILSQFLVIGISKMAAFICMGLLIRSLLDNTT